MDDETLEMPRLNISYKPQKISPKSTTTVRYMLHEKIPDMYQHPQFKTDVMNPLMIENLFDQEVYCFLRHISFSSERCVFSIGS